MRDSTPISSPMELQLKLQKIKEEPLNDVTKYRQLVGSLLYLTITMPDIVYVVGVMSQFMESPCAGHMIVAKRILQYVKGTLEYGLFYKENVSFSFHGYVDIDWARNAIDQQSTSEYCFSIGSAMISWCSKKKQTVSLSSIKVEYVVATTAAQECIWIKRLL